MKQIDWSVEKKQKHQLPCNLKKQGISKYFYGLQFDQISSSINLTPHSYKGNWYHNNCISDPINDFTSTNSISSIKFYNKLLNSICAWNKYKLRVNSTTKIKEKFCMQFWSYKKGKINQKSNIWNTLWTLMRIDDISHKQRRNNNHLAH